MSNTASIERMFAVVRNMPFCPVKHDTIADQRLYILDGPPLPHPKPRNSGTPEHLTGHAQYHVRQWAALGHGWKDLQRARASGASHAPI